MEFGGCCSEKGFKGAFGEKLTVDVGSEGPGVSLGVRDQRCGIRKALRSVEKRIPDNAKEFHF